MKRGTQKVIASNLGVSPSTVSRNIAKADFNTLYQGATIEMKLSKTLQPTEIVLTKEAVFLVGHTATQTFTFNGTEYTFTNGKFITEDPELIEYLRSKNYSEQIKP